MGRFAVGIYCLGDDAHSVHFLQVRIDIEEDE